LAGGWLSTIARELQVIKHDDTNSHIFLAWTLWFDHLVFHKKIKQTTTSRDRNQDIHPIKNGDATKVQRITTEVGGIIAFIQLLSIFGCRHDIIIIANNRS
jgi:hypothetical protein